MEDLLVKLNFTIPVQDLQSYYNTLNEKYQHLNWSWAKCGGDIVDQWRESAYQDPANLLTHGWAIQSNLKDITIPCPPWNISIHETVDYRNTELAFGIIDQLQKAIPYGYRWAVSVQPPGGKVSLHSDQEDEYTVWIPIYSKGTAITFVSTEKTIDYCLPSDGSGYLMNTSIPHYTENTSDITRVAIIFRLNQKHKNDVLTVTNI